MTGRYLCIAASLPLALGLSACKEDKNFADGGVEADASGADARTDLPNAMFPTDLAVGLVNCGGSQTFTFDVENTGGGDLDYEIASTNAAVFSVSPASGTLVADTSTTFTLTATMPSDSTPGTEVVGDLRITSDALAIDHIVNLHAAPRGAVLTLTPTAAGFGDVVFGTSGNRGVTVENSGNAPANVTIADPTDPEFAVAFVDGRVLANGASRVATVTYTPDGLGGDTATAAIAVTGPTCGAVPTSLSMSANGVPDGVLVTGNLAFGTQLCGADDGTSNLSIFNDGPVPATWTATLLADTQGDEDYYDLSATSGNVAIGQTATLTVSRLAIELPATPRAYDTVVRVVTTGQTVVSRDIPITQLLSGPVLSVTGYSDDKGGPYVDFGWGPADETLTQPLVVSNTGNASASNAILAVVAGSDASLGTASQVTVAAAGTGTLNAEYRAVVEGSGVDGTIEISAPNQCSDTISIDLYAGNGPWMDIGPTQTVTSNCNYNPFNLFGGPTIRSFLYVINRGNAPLTVSGCDEVTASDINPQFTYGGTTGIAPDGGTGSLALGWDNPDPLVSGSSAASPIVCDTNERFYQTRGFDLVRRMDGADLVVTQPDGAFTFDCADADSFKRLTITNNGNAASGYIYGGAEVPFPLYGLGSGFSVEPAASDSSMGVGKGSGSCFQGGGEFGIYTGSGNVCSIDPDPATFEVTLTGTIPNVHGTPRAGATHVRQPTRR